MALVVEDGTGKSNATSFVSLTTADSYWSSRGDETWAAATDAAKEAALVKAADYIGFGYTFAGQPLHAAQSLAWPRGGVIDARTGYEVNALSVPPAVVVAACLLAREALSTDILGQMTAAETVVKETVKLGDIETAKEYGRGSAPIGIRSFAQVDAVLSGLTISTNAADAVRSVQLVRR